MSFDLFLIAFAHGKPSAISIAAARAAFGDHVRWDDGGEGWTQYTDVDGCRISMSPEKSDPGLTSCVSLNRPTTDARLWDALYRIMQLGNVAVFFPGMKGPLVTDAGAARHLSPFESWGEAILVSSGAEILRQIQSA